MASIINFLLNGICNLQIGTMARIKIARSETTLKISVAIMKALSSKQWPLAISGFWIFPRGTHITIANVVSTE